ncbi:sushi, nidogen and EGF-like domain-containing protein 1 [Phyllobates terribilis]|uniref:sushi, nidogen and EGF-like domain-containing protein 1 n=1 Tax=Phyllobates terribilis TaxID=111132 RepID=UPI003CCB52EE
MAFCAALAVIALATFTALRATSSAARLLYPYGSENDTFNKNEDDGTSALIELYSNITLFGNVSSSLYVNNNGLLSFKAPISVFTPKDLPVADGNPFLAVFWADIDNVIAGNISYWQSNELSLLNQATSDVRSYFSLPSFSAALVFVATWHGVAYYGSSASSSMVNTFQAVLCSNGNLTFIMFNYESILWTTGTSSGGNNKGTGGTQALAGVNSGYQTGYYKIPGSLSEDMINISSTSNVNVTGRWVFRVDKLHPEDASGIIGDVEKCKKYLC